MRIAWKPVVLGFFHSVGAIHAVKRSGGTLLLE